MEIDASTSLYCVLGNPVSQSLSPAIHNLALGIRKINGVYTAFCVKNICDAVSGIRALGINGASVTIPHKQDVMAYLDEIDEVAVGIGAVNTIVRREGSLHGYNTDCMGAIKALEEMTDISGKRVVVLGAGGAARAIGFGIVKAGGDLFVCSRSSEKGLKLAGDLSAKFQLLSEFTGDDCDILINTTPVGMFPMEGETPVDISLLNKNMLVMDIVYNPLETRLLKDAKAVGARTIDGVSMFVYQAAEQFRLWTGQMAPVDEMRHKVLGTLTARGK